MFASTLLGSSGLLCSSGLFITFITVISKNNSHPILKLFTLKKSTDLIWVEKERQRSKEKYYRLNYKESQKIWDENKPWKKEAILKNLNKKLNIEKGFECHHWSYNPEHFEDVFIIEKKEHRKAHTFLKFNFDTKKFNDLNDNCLYSKIAHLNYLMQKGINVKIIN